MVCKDYESKWWCEIKRNYFIQRDKLAPDNLVQHGDDRLRAWWKPSRKWLMVRGSDPTSNSDFKLFHHSHISKIKPYQEHWTSTQALSDSTCIWYSWRNETEFEVFPRHWRQNVALALRTLVNHQWSTPILIKNDIQSLLRTSFIIIWQSIINDWCTEACLGQG